MIIVLAEADVTLPAAIRFQDGDGLPTLWRDFALPDAKTKGTQTSESAAPKNQSNLGIDLAVAA
jgi:hypothetical protein